MIDWEAVRGEFPALDHWTYLNTATFGQMPRRAVDAIARHLAHRDELACSDFLDWFTDADAVRGRIATLVGATAEDIAFCPNACSALSILMNGIDWRAGDRFLTLRGEFPNNLYAPAPLGTRGVESVEAGTWDELLEAIRPPVRLVALSTVNYSSGFRVPLDGLAQRVHDAGALLYVDGTQSLGALRFDVAEARPDMFAVHGYKWLLAPTGAGFLYVAPELRRRMPPTVVGWRSHKTWRQVDHLHHGTPEMPEVAEKYEGGMLAFPLLCAMDASVSMMLELGPESIERRVLELAEGVRTALRPLGAELASDTARHYDSPIVAARFPGRDVSAMARELKVQRVLVSARHGYLRVSTHFYNNEQDIERLAVALGRLPA